MSSDSEVRYKLVIDPSEDDSLIRILFTFDILSETRAKLYVSSDFPGDGNLQKVNALLKQVFLHRLNGVHELRNIALQSTNLLRFSTRKT